MDNEKNEIGPGTPPSRPVTFLIGKRRWKNRPASWDHWKVRLERRRRRNTSWLSVDTQSLAGKNLNISFIHAASSESWKQCPFCYPELSRTLSASLSSRVLVTFHRSELSPEGVHSVHVSDTLMGPQWHPWGRKQHMPLKPWIPPGNRLIILQRGGFLKSILPALSN